VRYGYDGYCGCPIFVGDNKLLLAEFKYGGEISETFPSFIQGSPSTLLYYMKVHAFPFIYYNLVKRGLWNGRDGFFKPYLNKVEAGKLVG